MMNKQDNFLFVSGFLIQQLFTQPVSKREERKHIKKWRLSKERMLAYLKTFETYKGCWPTGKHFETLRSRQNRKKTNAVGWK
jgi:hypothetical protein